MPSSKPNYTALTHQVVRDETAIAARNQQIAHAAIEQYRRSASGVTDWDMSSHLLAIGLYRDPVPPNPLKKEHEK